MKRVVVDPDAERDLHEIVDWYNQQQPGLSAEFLSAIDEAIAKAATHPEATA